MAARVPPYRQRRFGLTGKIGQRDQEMRFGLPLTQFHHKAGFRDCLGLHKWSWPFYKRQRMDMPAYQTSFELWSPRLLSVLRIVTALLFMMHGTAKLFQMPHQAMFDNLQLMSLMGLQGVLEAVGGFLLLIGLFSRPIAFILSGDMAVAYFIAHWPKGWLPILNGGDLAVLFCFVFLYLCVAGPGPWSVDARLRPRR